MSDLRNLKGQRNKLSPLPEDKKLSELCADIAASARRRFPALQNARLALSLWLPEGKTGRRGQLDGQRAIYPASVVKLFYLIAIQEWLACKRLAPSKELTRALKAMIGASSNDATNYVFDLLTDTTGGKELPPAQLARWIEKRRAVNRYFAKLGWPELGDACFTQKTWDEGPYGREWQSRFEVANNRNRFSTEMTARALWEIEQGRLVSPQACRSMKKLLARKLDPAATKAEKENQVEGFFGQGLPPGAKLWSKAGWTSQVRHDAAIIQPPAGPRFVLVAFTEGRQAAAEAGHLPFIASQALQQLSKLG